MKRDRDGEQLNLLIQAPGSRVGRRQFLRVSAILGLAGVAASCSEDTSPSGGQAASTTTLDNRPEEKVLNFYNWSDYIDEKTIPNFQKETGIKVNYDNYSSNEDLLSKMRAGKTTYDIIVPTNWFVPTYQKLDLIQPLRLDLIPNVENLDPAFREADYDPGNKYSIPWQWGTTGLGYNSEKVPGKVDSWKSLYEPDDSISGRISMLREVTDVIASTLIYLGKDPNSTDDNDLKQVQDTVRALKPKLKKFTSDTYIDELAGNETYLAQGWSGDVFQAQGENEAVGYVIPKEGSVRWADVMVVPKSAPHPKNAATFMNYVLDPEVAAAISEYVSYGTPVTAAKDLIPKEQLEDPSIYPPESIKLSIVTLSGPKILKWQSTFDGIISG